VFGVGLSELIFVKQRTQNDDGEMGRFIGLYGSRRAAGHKMLARRRQQKAHDVGLYLEVFTLAESKL
jgi:hypothetical protein